MSSIIVQKYGGSSVGSIEKIKCIAKNIIESGSSFSNGGYYR